MSEQILKDAYNSARYQSERFKGPWLVVQTPEGTTEVHHYAGPPGSKVLATYEHGALVHQASGGGTR